MFHPAPGGAVVLVGMDDVSVLEESSGRFVHDARGNPCQNNP